MLTTHSEPRDLTVLARDGLHLMARWWPVARPRATVVVAHGVGEHGGAYAHLAEAVGGALAIDVVALDFRGHGRSPGRRGVVRRYEELVSDLRDAVGRVRGLHPGLPLFVLGHSNGGQVVLRLALESIDGIHGVVASNPPIRIAMPVPSAKLKLGKLLLALAPWLTLRAETPLTWMTRDPAMQTIHRKDRLRHDRISAPLYFGMVEGGQMLLARAAEIRAPMLMLIGGSDPLICPRSGHDFYERVGSLDKTLHLYPRMLHEPFNELGREQVFDDLIRWLDARLA
jgi:alpha-beta hydrolase superfamily lysophospholipase